MKEFASRRARQRARRSSRVGRRLPHVHSLDPTLGKSFRAVIRKMNGRLVNVPDPSRITMGSTKAWTCPRHERRRLLRHLCWQLRCLIRLCSMYEVEFCKESGHGCQARIEAIVLKGQRGAIVLVLAGEDRRRLVHDVGHHHGNPLLLSSKNPLQEIVLDAVELPNRPIAYGLACTKGILKPGALTVPSDEHVVRNVQLNSSGTDGEFHRLLQTATLSQNLQLLADCVPPADLAGLTSRRPSDDGARHADKRALGRISRFGRGWGCKFGAPPPPFSYRAGLQRNSIEVGLRKWREPSV